MLTDVVGSTRLWQRAAVAMDAALTRHGELIEAAVSAHAGVVLKARGEGDSTFSVFGRASDAVRAALEVQRAFIAEPWPTAIPLSVRFAIHSGEAIERGDDFFGPAVNRAARLRAVGSGGDILLSGTTAALAVDDLPADVRLVELGTIQLRDLDRTERVFGVIADGIQPPAATLTPPTVGQPIPDRYGVTPREAEVLAALGERLTNVEIASRLYVSERTVESHVSALLRKMQVANRRDLARLAQELAGPDPRLELPLPAPLELAAESGTLVGRQEELQQLRRLWARAAAGRSLTVVVTGEAGIGKSRLVAELAADLHRSGGAVMLGSCFEDTRVPYQPFVQALGAELAGLSDPVISKSATDDRRALARLIPSMHDSQMAEIGDAPTRRVDLFDAVHRYLIRLAEVTPLLLVVEDLHWATPTTRATVSHIARAAERVPLLIVATARDGPPDVTDELVEFLGELARHPSVHRIPLQGLSEREVQQLIAAAESEGDAIDGRRYWAQTGGNPLLVNELLAGRGPQATVGTSVQSLLSIRSQRLSGDDNFLLDVAATIGSPFDAELLAVAIDAPLAQVLEALERTEAAGLTTDATDRPSTFAFVHTLFRSIRYEALPGSRRLRLHHMVAAAYQRWNGDSDQVVNELARHTCAAIPLCEPAIAIGYSRRAGDLAMVSLAFEEAADHFRRALRIAELEQPLDPLRFRQLTARLGDALVEADNPEASVVLERAAHVAHELANNELLATITWTMSTYALTPVHFNPLVVSRAQEALEGIGPEPTAARARLLTILAAHAEGSDEPDRRCELVNKALTTARLADDPIALGQVLSRYQVISWNPDNLSDRVAAANELANLAHRLDQRIWRIFAHHALYSNYLEAGAVKTAWAEATAIEQLVADRHDTFSQLGISSRRATRLLLAGELDAAEEAADRMLALAEELAPSRGIDPLNIYGPHLMVIRFNQGRLGELIPLIRDAHEAHPAVDAYQAVLASALARSGEFDVAHTILCHLTNEQAAAIPRNMQWYSTMMCLADTADLTGDADVARMLFDQLQPYTGRLAVHGTGVSQPIDLALAQLALTCGDHRRAATIAATAAEAGRLNNTPIHLARVLIHQAAAQLLLGEDRRHYEPLVEEAHAIAQRTGAGLITQESSRYGFA